MNTSVIHLNNDFTLETKAILNALIEMGLEWENVSWGTNNDDICILLKGYVQNNERAHRFVSITLSGNKLKISNCQHEIDLCHPNSLEILGQSVNWHKALHQNYSCAGCPIMRL